GQKLRVRGKGLPLPGGGEGDLYAVLQVVTPSVLSEREKQLYRELQQASTFNPRAHFSSRAGDATMSSGFYDQALLTEHLEIALEELAQASGLSQHEIVE